MQLYAVNFIPQLSSLYMFRAAHTPIISSTTFNCIYIPRMPGTDCSQCLASLETSSHDNLRQPMIVPVAVDTVEHCTPDDGRVRRPKHVE